MAMESYSTNWGPSVLGLRQYWGTAAPSATTDVGPYSVGDIVWNTVPTAGGTVCWICTTAGATGAAATFTALTLS